MGINIRIMVRMSEIENLLATLDAYAAATGLAEGTVSSRLLGHAGRIAAVRAGGDIGVRTVRRTLEKLSTIWPEGTPRPEGLPRPPTAGVRSAAE